MLEILFEKGKIKKIKRILEAQRGLRIDVDADIDAENYERWYTFDIWKLGIELKEGNLDKIKEKLNNMSLEELEKLVKRNDLLICTDEAYTIRMAKS